MEMQKTIERAKKLRGEGLSFRKIARKMNQEGFKSVSGARLTDNSVYYYVNYRERNSARRDEAARPSAQLSALIQLVGRAELSEQTKTKIIDSILDDVIAR